MAEFAYEAINASGRRVLAVDLPSGLDADTGHALSPTVRADVTVTLGLAKAGLLAGDGPALAGEVWLVDIGIPREAYAMVGAAMPAHLFSMHDRAYRFPSTRSGSIPKSRGPSPSSPTPTATIPGATGRPT